MNYGLSNKLIRNQQENYVVFMGDLDHWNQNNSNFKAHLGKIYDDLNFDISEDIKFAGGCGATLMDQMMYFGGFSSKRQVNQSKEFMINCITTNYYCIS